MENMNTTLNDNHLGLLASLLGKRIISFKYDKDLSGKNFAFEKIGIASENGYLLIDNHVDWYDNYFSHGDYIPSLIVSKIETEEDIHINKELKEFITIPVDDIVLDILLVQDKLEIVKASDHYQDWNSTEGIIFVTKERQYGFYKDTTWLDESLLVYRGQDVFPMFESLEKHWHIFGKPFTANCKRYVYSLMSKESRLVESATEIESD